MKITPRSQALSEKLPRYFTGKPCKHGHVSERQTSNGCCLECHRLKELAANRSDPNRMTSRNKRYYSKHKTKMRVRRQTNYQNNREQEIASVRRYQKENPKRKNAVDARRRAAKLCRTPPWADLEAIKQFYIECPEDMTVDHIIPLQGKRVSGLHVFENLQYLTPSKNCSKSNHFDPERFPSQRLPSLCDPSHLAASQHDSPNHQASG